MFNSLLKTVLLFIITSFSVGLIAQSHDHDSAHTHLHKKHEISLALGAASLFSENKVAPAIHLHYVRGIALDNRLGLGLAAEAILEEHKHYALAAVVEYKFNSGLVVGYAPGLLMLIEETETEYAFAQHFELAFEFDLNKVHLGPLLELGIEPHGVHLLYGIHCGIDF